MQSSMWKLLTAAGIIGIGTLVVLEVQNRLPMASHTSAPTAAANIIGTGTSADTDVIPDATVDFDRMLSGSEAVDDPQFALNEPNAPEDTGARVPPAEDQVFVGVTPVDRTVLKDSLADEANPFDRSLGSGNDQEPAHTLEADTAKTPEATAIQPASFSREAAQATETNPASEANPAPEANPATTAKPATLAKPASTSTTQFFNGRGSKEIATPTPKSNAAPVVATAPAKTVIPASAQAFGDDRTAADSNAAVRSAVKTAQVDEETPQLFMPDAVPEIGRPTNPSAPGGISVAEEPLMETPGFATDPQPNFGPTPESENPGIPLGGSLPPDRNPNPPGRTPPPARIDEDTPFFQSDEPVPTPPAGDGRSKPDTDPEPTPVFELDPVPALDDSRTPPRATPERGPRATPPDLSESDFPAPTYPDRKSAPGLSDDEMFDAQPNFRGDTDDSSNLPVISDRPSRTTPDRTRTGSDAPGDTAVRNMSEVMRPQLSIQKRAPDTATVGVSHEYTIVVSNEGDSTAYDVIVDDELGNGAKLENSRPTADFDRVSGKLSWTIRELAPHAKQEILVRITPTGEGTLDGIATVRFKAQVKSATVITAPKLTLEVTGPDEVKVGDDVQLRYVISNNGSGDASHVILRSVLPPGLKHSEGGDLEYEIENLRAGDREEIDLTVVAAEPGRIRTVSEVTASGVSADKATTDIDIVGSQLTIQRLGPERRFVGRRAKFQNIIANETNFEATDAIVTEQVPEGMKFVSADNGGEYSPQTGQIRWELARLAPGKQIVLEVELEAESAGQRQTVVEVVEQAGFRSEATENTMVTVADYENMTANISRQDAPVAIGETFGFTITIENRGTAVARNVEMVIDVPEEIAVKAAGTRTIPARRTGNAVRYAIVDEIQPAEKMTFELKLQGERPAQNALVRASLKYEQMTEPLIVSESVTIFDDRP